MKELLLVVFGGLLAIVGGIIGKILDSRLRRRDTRNELIAQKEVDVCAKAYRVLKEVITVLDQAPHPPDFQRAGAILASNESWFWENRLWFPGQSANAWLLCRKAVATQQKDESIVQANSAVDAIYTLLRVKQLSP